MRLSELWVFPQVELVDHEARKRAALQNSVLGFVVIVAQLVLLQHLLKRDDVRVHSLDENLGRALVDANGGKRVQGSAQDDGQKDGRDDVAAPVDDLEIVDEAEFRVASDGTAVAVAVACPSIARPTRPGSVGQRRPEVGGVLLLGFRGNLIAHPTKLSGTMIIRF